MKTYIFIALFVTTGCAQFLPSYTRKDTISVYFDSLLNTKCKSEILKNYGLPTNSQVIANTEVWEYYQNRGVTQITNGSSYQAGVFNNGMSYAIPVQHYMHYLFYFDLDENLTYWKWDGR